MVFTLNTLEGDEGNVVVGFDLRFTGESFKGYMERVRWRDIADGICQLILSMHADNQEDRLPDADCTQ